MLLLWSRRAIELCIDGVIAYQRMMEFTPNPSMVDISDLESSGRTRS